MRDIATHVLFPLFLVVGILLPIGTTLIMRFVRKDAAARIAVAPEKAEYLQTGIAQMADFCLKLRWIGIVCLVLAIAIRLAPKFI